MFEGEYKNDLKWDGKGYDSSDNLVYELNNGKGMVKEYDKSGKLIFDGEYLNGKRHGKGKEYNCNFGNLKFEGQYLNGKRQGKGKEYNNGDLYFEGEYLNDKKNGIGKKYYYGKLVFEIRR